MSEEGYERIIEVLGHQVTLTFIRRPFREGLEVRIESPWGQFSLAELGLGEQALVERARALLESEAAKRS